VSEETILEAVRNSGADGVIITRLVKAETQTAVSPGYSHTTVTPAAGFRSSLGAHRSFYGYYRSAWTTYQPPTVYRFQVVTLETNLWAVNQKQLVWSGLTQTAEGGNVNKDIDDLVRLITDALSAGRII
jgi:hypothetical protein